jgi:hypothetical protein
VFDDGLPLSLAWEANAIQYSSEELQAALNRLQEALEVDLGNASVPNPQQLSSAWVRIAELRLPRMAVPRDVLESVESLVSRWDSMGTDGMQKYAYVLSAEERSAEAERIRAMLAAVKEAARDANRRKPPDGSLKRAR